MAYWDKIGSNRLARRRLLKGGASLSVGAAALALIGCGSDDEEPSPTNTTASGGGGGSASPTAAAATPTVSTAGQPKAGGTFGAYFATIGSYNTAVFYHDGYNNSGITVYDRLTTSTLESRGFDLQAAESLERPDELTAILKLKPGMVFQDLEPANGRAVKASDVVAYQEYIKALPNAENSGFQRLIMDKVEAPDDSTVKITLKKPYAYLTAFQNLSSATAFLIVPEEMLDVFDEHPAVGSGPWELTDHTFGAEYNYKKFDKWRDAATRGWFEKMHIISLTDPVAQETAFRGGEISEWQPAGSAVDRLLGELDKAKYANVTYLSPGLGGFNANMNAEKGGPKPWHDVRVREAFYRLSVPQQWIDLVLDGKGIVPPGPVQAALEAYQLEYSETEKYLKEDVAAAKQLLEAAQYDTSKTYEILCSNSSPTNAQIGEVWQQQLDRGGIKVTITPLPLAEMNPNRINPANFDLFIGGQPGNDTPIRAIRNNHSDTTDQFTNVGLFLPEIDALIEKSEQTIDRDENIKLVKEIQLKVLDLYTMSYNGYASEITKFYDARTQNYDNDQLNGQHYYVDMWFEEA